MISYLRSVVSTRGRNKLTYIRPADHSSGNTTPDGRQDTDGASEHGLAVDIMVLSIPVITLKW